MCRYVKSSIIFILLSKEMYVDFFQIPIWYFISRDLSLLFTFSLNLRKNWNFQILTIKTV